MLNQLTHTNQIEWKLLNGEHIAGVWIKELRFDSESKRLQAKMLKFGPGAGFPTHIHPGGEELFVLEGTVRIGNDFLSAGDYLYTAPNNIHDAFSEEGCILLLIAPEQVIILDENNEKKE